MINRKLWLISLLLLTSAGCIGVKLNGFEEIAARNPRGMEDATSTPDGEKLIRELGHYISELEFRLESQ